MNNALRLIDSICELVIWFVIHIVREWGIKRIPATTCEKEVAIIGNGTSTKHAIPKLKQQNYDFCFVNFSPLSDLFFEIKPRFYIAIDPAFYTPKQELLAKKVNTLAEQFTKIDWDITCFVPYRYLKEATARYKCNTHITFIPICYNKLPDNFMFKRIKFWLMKRNLAGPYFMNVGVAAIYSLMSYGFKRIHLYGMEHSWLKSLWVDKDNFLCLQDDHYYDKSKVEVTKLYIDGRPEHLHENLRFLAFTFAAYWDLKEYATHLGGIEIINNTPSSYIDAFKKEWDE